jgi:hypothetical protein
MSRRRERRAASGIGASDKSGTSRIGKSLLSIAPQQCLTAVARHRRGRKRCETVGRKRRAHPLNDVTLSIVVRRFDESTRNAPRRYARNARRIVGAWKLCILAADLQILCAPNSLSPSKSQLCSKQTTLFHKFPTLRKKRLCCCEKARQVRGAQVVLQTGLL